MTVYNKVFIGGSEFSDVLNSSINRSISENNQASTFEVVFPNERGQHANDFSVGQEACFYSQNYPFLFTDKTPSSFNGVISGATFSTDVPTGFSGYSIEFDGADSKVETGQSAINNSLDVSASQTLINGVCFRDDGLKMYIVGQTPDYVHEYNLSTAWDISTASILQFKDISSQETEPEDIRFSSDGTKMFILGNTGNDVTYYTLSTAWDISTATYVGEFSVATQETIPLGLDFSTDGTKMYVLGSTEPDTLHQYNLGTAWDLTTAAFSQSVDINSYIDTGHGLMFSPDGLKMFIVEDNSNSVKEFDLSTAWDISTYSYSGRICYLNNGVSTTPTGIFIGKNGTRMYIADYINVKVWELELSKPWTFINGLYENGFTFAAWIKGDTIGETNGTIFDNSYNLAATTGVRLYCGTNQLIAVINTTSPSHTSATNSVVWGNGNWYHVVWTVNKDAYSRLYVNGSESGTSKTLNALSGITIFVDKSTIGNRSATTDRTFDGKMKQVCFWNRPLTSSEITSLYGGSVPNSNLVWRYDFDEGSGTVATNSSPIGLGSEFFCGNVEEVRFDGNENLSNERVVVYGRDFSSKLQNVTVEPCVYAGLEAGSIVKALIASEYPSITTSNVGDTGYTVDRIRFSHVSLYDAIKELAELAGDWFFYVDNDNDLNFKPLNTTSTGYSFSSDSNIMSSSVQHVNREMYNQVWVYGDRQLTAAPRVTRAASGAPGAEGSVYSLDWKPHNTSVYVGGSTASKIGGVFNFVGQGDPGSPIQYLVDYEGQKIVFVSGATAGMNIPGSNVTILIDYQRQTPVVKYGQDQLSVATYGPREKFVQDKNIKDPRTATEVVLTTLDREAYPVVSASIDVKGWYDIMPGNTVGAVIPFHNVSGANLNVVAANYVFNKDYNLKETNLNLHLNKKLIDGVDVIKGALLDITRLKAQELEATDLFSRIEVATGSEGIRVDSYNFSTKTLGSSFVINSAKPSLGMLGKISNNSGSIFNPSGTYWSSGINTNGNGFNNSLFITGSPMHGYVPFGSEYTLSTDTSIACWLAPGSIKNAHIVSAYYAAVGERGWLFYQLGSQFRFYTANSTYVSGVGAFVVDTPVHIAGTYSGTMANVYINGSLISSGTVAKTEFNNGSGFFIGAYPDLSNADFYYGKINDLVIYNRGLTSGEVLQIYNGSTVAGSLIGYWRFRETSGVIFYDDVSGSQPFLGDSRSAFSVQASGGLFGNPWEMFWTGGWRFNSGLPVG